MGSLIKVSSEFGKWTKFWFSLPLSNYDGQLDMLESMGGFEESKQCEEAKVS